jgi:CDP-diglyceride synthetase
MRFLAEFILSVVELFESEARSLSHGITALIAHLVFLAAGMFLFIAGVCLILLGFYELLTMVMSSVASIFIVGGLTLILGVIFIYVVRNAARRR